MKWGLPLQVLSLVYKKCSKIEFFYYGTGNTDLFMSEMVNHILFFAYGINDFNYLIYGNIGVHICNIEWDEL